MAGGTSVELELMKTLGEVVDDERENLQKAVLKAARQAKQDVVAASPENRGAYKKGWTVKTRRTKQIVEAVVYNKDAPGLTHLLEKSHVIRNQSGTYGRTSPGHGQVEHIAPAARKAEEYLLELVENGQ